MFIVGATLDLLSSSFLLDKTRGCELREHLAELDRTLAEALLIPVELLPHNGDESEPGESRKEVQSDSA